MVGKEFEEKEGMKIRKYKDYNEYTEHQKSKLGIITWLDKYDVDYRKVLLGRLKELAIEFKGKNVLCLAARTGTEVKAFIDLGANARGIDLNPGENNKLVDKGDFHNIQKDDSSIDIVFTNSFDHSLEPYKLISEIKRILIKDGLLIMEVSRGSKDEHGSGSGSYECLEWEYVDDVVKLFQKRGFELLNQKKFNHHGRYTWGGEQLVFTIK